MPSFSVIIARSTIALAVAAAASSANGGMDLTPAVSEYVAEGAKFQQLTFQYNKQQIEYEPPTGWKFDGGPKQLHLKPPQKNFAEATIEVSALDKPQPLDENAHKVLKEQILASLPVGSQFAKVEEEATNPVLLNGNESFEVTVSYQSIGEKFFKSALFVNLKDTQLKFRLTARKDDFQALHREFKSSILSWHWRDETEAPAQPGQAGSAATAP